MIEFTVTFDQDVTVTGTPEFEFCLGSTATVSCSRRHAPAGSAERRAVERLGHDDAGVQLHGRGRRHGHRRHLDRESRPHDQARHGGRDRRHGGRARRRAHPRGGGHPALNGEATDRAALVALYNATSGPNWTINTNWLTTAALSEWYGAIDRRRWSSHLQHVYLAQNELSGEIPVELGDLTNLQILYLSQNMLSGAIPAALGDLTSLQQLDISQNGLSGEIPAALGDLSSLQILYLWGNELSGAIPASWGI